MVRVRQTVDELGCIDGRRNVVEHIDRGVAVVELNQIDRDVPAQAMQSDHSEQHGTVVDSLCNRFRKYRSAERG